MGKRGGETRDTERLRVNPISLSYPFPLPLPLSFARSRESKGYPNSRFDRGVGLRGSGRYPLKPSIFASLLETKGYPEHTAQPATMSVLPASDLGDIWAGSKGHTGSEALCICE